jgi:hypothetical protein
MHFFPCFTSPPQATEDPVVEGALAAAEVLGVEEALAAVVLAEDNEPRTNDPESLINPIF